MAEEAAWRRAVQRRLDELTWRVDSIDESVLLLTRAERDAITEDILRVFRGSHGRLKERITRVYLALDGRLSQREVSQQTGIAESNVSVEISTLKREGLIEIVEASASGHIYKRKKTDSLLGISATLRSVLQQQGTEARE
jgi:biotin operon repressor